MYLVYSHCINNILSTREKMRKWDCIFVNISRNCVVIFFGFTKLYFRFLIWGLGVSREKADSRSFFSFGNPLGYQKRIEICFKGLTNTICFLN